MTRADFRTRSGNSFKPIPASRRGLTQALGRMNILLRTLLALLLVSPFNAFAQTRLTPVDQAASLPDFFSFRAQLMTAIARHDADAVLSVLSKDVKLSFGGDEGIDDFKKIWRPGAPDSHLWETLAATLAFGGTFGDGTFTAPYVFTRWPQDKDVFTHVAVVGAGVRVRSTPSTSATAIDVLDFPILELTESQAPEGKWVQVKLPSGSTGFVDARFIRSPIDYRVSFAKIDGRWQLVFFLAGD